MTGVSTDLFHRGWEGGIVQLRRAFSSTIHSAVVLQFQCRWGWGFEEEGSGRVAVDGALWRAVPDPSGWCLCCPFQTIFFRPSCWTVCADSPWGALGNVLRGIRGNLGSSELLKPWWQLWLSETPNTHTHHSVVQWSRWLHDPIPSLTGLFKTLSGWKGTRILDQDPALPWRNPVTV